MAIEFVFDGTDPKLQCKSPDLTIFDIGITNAGVITTDNGGGPVNLLLETGGTPTGVWDFGGATSLEIPNSATPTVNADGELALDTTVTDFSLGVMKFFGGEEQGVVSMPIAQFTSPTNGHVVTYNATNDEFELVAQTGGSDTFTTIQVDGVAQSTNAPTLDFDGTDFTLTESPTDDFDVTINAERIQDIAGAMVTGNTETGIAVTYQDGDGTIDFVVDTASATQSGIAELATTAETTTGTDTGRVIPVSALPVQIQDSKYVFAADAEASDTYVITLAPAPSALAAGQVFHFDANTVNTGAATLNVNGLGAITIKKHHDQDLANGDIEAGQHVTVIYDGTNFQMQSQLGNAPSGSGDVTGDTASVDKELVRFNSTTGKVIESPNTDLSSTTATLSDNADLTLYDAVNDGNPVFSYGSSATERLTITPTYDSGAQTLDYVQFTTDVASATADKGEFRFSPDGALVATIDDGGIELADTMAYFIDTSNVLSETTLGSTVVSSSLTSVGTITTGTWQGTVVDHERGGLELDVSAFDGLIRISGGSTTELKSDFAKTAAPTVDDDTTLGYVVGSRWIDTTNDKEYVCLDNTDTAAVWTETTAGAAGGDPDQNLWETISSDSGSVAANIVTDTLTVSGGNGIDTSISGDTLTIAGETASATNAGISELATAAETTTGTDTGRTITPDGLAGSDYGKREIQVLITDPNGNVLETGDGKAHVTIRSIMNGWNLVEVAAHVSTASTSGLPTIQIHNVTDAVDMLSTLLTIDANEKDSDTAATAAVINTANDDVATGDELRIDVDTAGTGTKGLIVCLIFQLP